LSVFQHVQEIASAKRADRAERLSLKFKGCAMKSKVPFVSPQVEGWWSLSAVRVAWFLLLASGGLSAQTVFSGPRDYIGGSGFAVVVADFNGDGRPDIASLNSNGISVFVQNSDGTFQAAVSYPTGNSPTLIQVGDVDNDGKLDILTESTTTTNILSVLLGNGDGTFQAAKSTTLPASSNYLAVGDFNGDGKLDAAVVAPLPVVGTYGVAILSGNGDGTFQAPVSYPTSGLPTALATADFNNDKRLDLVTMNSSNVSVLLGNGDGSFQAPIATSLSFLNPPLGLVIADFNLDGNLDIATSSGFLTLLLGNGNGTFQVQVLTGSTGAPFAAGDLNSDGKPDLVANGPDNIESLLNNGDGTFTTVEALGTQGIAGALSDLNGNQKLDLVLSSGGYGDLDFDPGIVSVVYGNGDGTFATFPVYPLNQNYADLGTLATADFNGDGKTDLVIGMSVGDGHGNPTEQVVLLLNDGSGFSGPTRTELEGIPFTGVYVGAGDFNGDGKADLAVAGGGVVAILLGNGNGTFQSEVDYGAGMTGPLAVGDFNGDGKLDVIGTNGGGISVLLGKGDGTFGLPINSAASSQPFGFAVGDFNGDGKLDVALLADVTFTPPVTAELAVLFGNGDGTFSPGPTYSFPFNPDALASGDLNGDKILDLVVGVHGAPGVPDSVVVLLGKGDGTFQGPITTVAGNQVQRIAIADFNLDGKQDVVLSNSGWGDVSLLLGNGDGTFQTPMEIAALTTMVFGGGGGLAVADFDGSGSPDLAVAGGVDGISLLLSTGKNGSAALLSATAIAFGSQNVGQASAVQTAVLSNTNSTALSITSLSLSGTQSGDYQQSNTCGTSLAAGASCTISVTFVPQGAGTRTAMIQISDSAFNSPQTISLSGIGVAASDFTFGMASGGSSSSTIAAGGTATFGLSLAPTGSFSGTVNLTCAITPAVTPAPVCSVPASVSVGSAATPVTVTVTTTAASSAVSGRFDDWPRGWLVGWTLALGASTLLFMGRRRRFVYAPVFVLLLLMEGCGGGSSPSPTPAVKGTPAGTYTGTVTATSGSLSHQAALTVIVQ
jgi:hypothetical protein